MRRMHDSSSSSYRYCRWPGLEVLCFGGEPGRLALLRRAGSALAVLL
jgi:hypothetical protein